MIDDYLVKGEELLRSCPSGDGVAFYLTDRRLLRLREGAFGSMSMVDISLKEITSISLETEAIDSDALAGAIIAAVVGLLALVFRNFLGGFWDIEGIVGIVGGVLIAIGVLGATATFHGRKTYYGMRGPGLLREAKEAEQWRLFVEERNRHQVEAFARAVRQYLV